MFGLKRFFILTLLPLPLVANQVLAVDLPPSAEVQKNIVVLTKTKSCLNCDLSGAVLNRLDLSGANLKGANLSRSTMALTNLSSANLQNTDLREAVFTGADLANTDMRGADLTGASFSGAYMVGALMDGEMLSTKPYAKDDISDVEESVYVEDTVKAKRPQLTNEMTIGNRRDFEETPPPVPAGNIKKKVVQGPPAAVFVEETPIADSTPLVETIPVRSVAAPEVKAAPAMNEVRIQEDVEPESLPVIDEMKKEKSTEIVPETTVQKETVTESMKNDESIELENIVAGTNNDAHQLEIENKIEVPEEKSSTVAATLAEEDSVVMESKDIPVETEGVAVEIEGIETDSTKAIAEETKIVDSTEVLSEPIEDSSGVFQKVINIFSSVEPSTEVLKNASLLLDSKRCYGCNLQGVNLSGENLDSADLEGADLSNAILTDVDFEEANLKGANLSGADLSGADLSEADLYNADLSGANLTGANLEKALLDDVILTGVIGYNNSSILLLDPDN